MPKEIFRKGADIYAIEGDSARLLGPTEFGSNFANQANNVTDLGQRDDLYNQYFPAPTPAPVADIPGISPSESDGVVDGTQDITDANTLANQEIDAGIAAADDDTETPDAALTRLINEQSQLKTLTQSDLDAIDAAGEEARLAYQPMVDETIEGRRKTLPSEVVRAGERGGFLSTQQAGVAAVLPTDPKTGEAFVGAGGALDAKRQTLDRAVATAKAKQQEAILAAKRAQRQAILTGKRSDYDMSLKLIQVAQQFANDKESLKMQQKNLDLSIAADKRAETSAQYNIMKDIKSGEKIVVNGQTFIGIAKEETEPFFTQDRLFDIMGKLEEGETVTVTDPITGEAITINGFMPVDTESNTQTFVDDRGYAHVIDLDTGKEIAKSETPVGKSKTQATNVTLNMNEQRQNALQTAIDDLNKNGRGPDGKWGTDLTVEKFTEYITLQPGRAKDFQDIIRANNNLNDPKIKAILNLKIDSSNGTVKYTNPNGESFEVKSN